VTDPAPRIVDVNLNRAREALRVLDDFARFGRNDRVLTEEVKRLRHAVAAAAELLPPGLLLSARDTPGDIGTAVTVQGEFERPSARHVATVNLKRFQESLRSLEEYGKVLSPSFAERIERIRYDAYTLERALAPGPAVRERFAAAKLYVLMTGDRCVNGWEQTVREAAAGGATVFQLREKQLSDRELLDRAKEFRRVTRDLGALFVMNDRPDLAALVEADGVHLGQDDLPVAAARRIVGSDVAIGISTHSAEQICRAVLDGADYLGVGPTFPSTTKSFDHFPGLAFVTEATELTSLPSFVLGGVTAANVLEVSRAGGRRVAVAAAVTAAADPKSAAAALVAGL
jgi:thiamine-phosphate pyrophosphorylase